MKTLLTRFSLLAMLMATLGLASCTEEDGLGGGTSNSKVSVTSLSSTSIGVRWTNPTTTDQIVATPTSGAGSPVTVNITGATGQGVLTGLTNGQSYDIVVKNGSETSAKVTWAPATRWPSEANPSATVRLFETAAPINVGPSGLIIDETGMRAVSTEGNEQTRIDLVLATQDPARVARDTIVSLVSPSISSESGIPGGRKTAFADKIFYVTGGLDNDYYTVALSTLVHPSQDLARNALDIVKMATNHEGYNKSLILVLRTQDNHYARVEVLPQPAGSPRAGQHYGIETITGNEYKFVDVRASYQLTTGLGYASRPSGIPAIRRAISAGVVKN